MKVTPMCKVMTDYKLFSLGTRVSNIFTKTKNKNQQKQLLCIHHRVQNGSGALSNGYQGLFPWG
jgi:hypothetical protein